MELKKLNKEEAKKLKTRFNNYRKTVSWDEFVNSWGHERSPFGRGIESSEGIKETFNKMWLGSRDTSSEEGLKVELKGRVRGAAKSRKLSNIKGSVKSQSIDWNIEYNKKEIYTKWGILGLKIWLVK